MIPVVLVHRSGREQLVGQAPDMESAKRLLFRLDGLYAPRRLAVYIDCARTPEEIQANYWRSVRQDAAAEMETR